MTTHELSALTQDVIDGNEDPIKAFAIVKSLMSHCELCLKEIKPLALVEAAKYEKHFSLHGFSFELRGGSTRYDFKGIQEWVDKQEELKELESKYKAAYLSYKKGLMPVTSDSEVLVLPKVKNDPDSLILKL